MPGLGTSIGASDTVIELGVALDVGRYPSRYTLGSEAIYVTGGSGTRYLSVIRGADDTDAAAHAVNTALVSAPIGSGAGGSGVTVDNGVDAPAAVTTLVAPGAVIAGDQATLVQTQMLGPIHVSHADVGLEGDGVAYGDNLPVGSVITYVFAAITQAWSGAGTRLDVGIVDGDPVDGNTRPLAKFRNVDAGTSVEGSWSVEYDDGSRAVGDYSRAAIIAGAAVKVYATTTAVGSTGTADLYFLIATPAS